MTEKARAEAEAAVRTKDDSLPAPRARSERGRNIHRDEWRRQPAAFAPQMAELAATIEELRRELKDQYRRLDLGSRV